MMMMESELLAVLRLSLPPRSGLGERQGGDQQQILLLLQLQLPRKKKKERGREGAVRTLQ